MIKYVLFYIFFIYSACTMYGSSEAIFQVKQGVLDLSEYDFQSESPIQLDGDWLFMENDFSGYDRFPGDARIQKVPVPITGQFFGTYYCKIFLPAEIQGHNLMLSVKGINTAAEFFVNGKSIIKIGTPTRTRNSAATAYNYKTGIFKVETNIVHLIVHASNHEFTTGGIIDSLKLGNPDKIQKSIHLRNCVNAFLLTSIFITLLHHFLIYIIRRKEYASLLYAIISLIVLLRTSLTESYLYNLLPYHYYILFRVECITFYMIVPAFVYFIGLLFPEDFNRKINHFLFGVGIITSIACIFSPMNFSSYFLKFYQIITLFVIAYITGGTIRAIRYKRNNINVFIIGIFIIIFAFTNDVLFYMRILAKFRVEHSGMFVFLLFQAMVLSIRYSKAFTENEIFSKELEELVDIRTSELNAAMNELIAINEKNRQDLVVARKLQAKLVPSNYQSKKEIHVESAYIPMEELGGDLFDVYYPADNRIVCMILDVCGHGVPAALVTTMAKVLFSNAVKLYDDPSRMVSYVNDELLETIQGSRDFLTVFIGVFDTADNTLTYVNAGHTDILKINKTKEVEFLPVTGTVVGVAAHLEYGSKTIHISPQDRFILYTDGITEAMNQNKEMFGLERLVDIALKEKESGACVFIRNLFSMISDFREDAPVNDDCALMSVDIL